MNKHHLETEIREKIVLTKHAYENYTGRRKDGEDRTNITIEDIVGVLVYGRYAYSKNHLSRKIYKGIEVVYKIDDAGYYVVITYCRKTSKRKFHNICYRNYVDKNRLVL